MRRFLNIFLLTAFCLILAGCRDRLDPADKPVPDKEQKGDLILRIGSSSVETKTDDAKEGLAFNNVLVLIGDAEGNVIDKVFKQYPYVPQSVTDLQGAVSETELESDVIQFHDLKVSAYQVYVYANIGHTAWQISGSTIEDVEKQLTIGGENKIQEDRLLKTLDSGEVPSNPGADTGMLLTGHKELYVGVNANIGEIELIRPVVRFNVYVHNHTPFDVKLLNLSFSSFNPSVTYLLDHRKDDNSPTIPAGVTYGSLPAYDSANPVVISATSDSDPEAGNQLVYSTLLYENETSEDYRMFATVYLKDDSDSENIKEFTNELTTDGVRLLMYDEIAAMSDGDSKNVMFVNPTSNYGCFYGANGGSTVYSYATYSIADYYASEAKTLLGDASKGKYYKLVLSKENGVFHLNRVNNGATEKYLFKNINIDGGSSNNESGLTLVEGFVPSYTDYIVPAGFDARLSRFKDSKNRYLYNRRSNNNNLLSVSASQTDRGNRMWAFYEINPIGSTLKFIDKETAQVKPLRYMTRNQELNVVMNVYYQQNENEFTFKVDNVYWTSGHTSSHIFK